MVAIRLASGGFEEAPVLPRRGRPIRAPRATAASSKSSATTIRAPSRRSSKVDRERVDYWIKKGAQPSDSVRTLIARHLTPAPAPRRRPAAPAR